MVFLIIIDTRIIHSTQKRATNFHLVKSMGLSPPVIFFPYFLLTDGLFHTVYKNKNNVPHFQLDLKSPRRLKKTHCVSFNFSSPRLDTHFCLTRFMLKR